MSVEKDLANALLPVLLKPTYAEVVNDVRRKIRSSLLITSPRARPPVLQEEVEEHMDTTETPAPPSRRPSMTASALAEWRENADARATPSSTQEEVVEMEEEEEENSENGQSEKQHTKSVDIEEENEPIEKEKEENKRIEKEKEESRSDIGESAKQHEKSVDIEEENERIQKEKEEIERIEKEKEQCRSDIGERNQSGSAVLKSSVGTLNEKTTSKKRFETIPSGIHRISNAVILGKRRLDTFSGAFLNRSTFPSTIEGKWGEGGLNREAARDASVPSTHGVSPPSSRLSIEDDSKRRSNECRSADKRWRCYYHDDRREVDTRSGTCECDGGWEVERMERRRFCTHDRDVDKERDVYVCPNCKKESNTVITSRLKNRLDECIVEVARLLQKVDYLSTKTAKLEEILNGVGDCYQSLKKELNKLGVSRARYHQTYNGRQIGTVMRVSNLATLFKCAQLKRSEHAHLWYSFVAFRRILKLSKPVFLDDTDIEKLENLVKIFKENYVLCVANPHDSVKFHIMTKHLVEFAREHKMIGLFTEEALEHIHHELELVCDRFKNIGESGQRLFRAILEREVTVHLHYFLRFSLMRNEKEDEDPELFEERLLLEGEAEEDTDEEL